MKLQRKLAALVRGVGRGLNRPPEIPRRGKRAGRSRCGRLNGTLLRFEACEERLNLANIFGGEASVFDFANNTVEILEGTIGTQSDAFATVGRIAVDGTVLGGMATFAGNSATYPTQSISGLGVSADFFVAVSTATVRQMVHFNNPTGDAITVNVELIGNLGSDGDTQITSSSNFNSSLEISDRWMITDDVNSVSQDDPAVTTVVAGPGTGPSLPAVLPITATLANGNYSFTYSVTLQAGQTRSLMFFHQINPTAAEANTNAFSMFQTNPVPGNDFLAGLTSQQLNQVLNWQFNIDPGTILVGGEGSVWQIINGTSVNPISDAAVGSSVLDAFDGAGTISLFGVPMSQGPVTMSGNTATFPAVGVNGVTASLEYFAAPQSATLRQMLLLINQTPLPIVVPVEFGGNLGSDGGTQIVATSDSDTTLEPTDRWLITDDGDVNGGDPTVTTVVRGPGSPAVSPSAAVLNNSQNMLFTYNVTLLPGLPTYLMFFHQLSPTSAEAMAKANAFFDQNPLLNNDLAVGLSPGLYPFIVNWDFSLTGANRLHGGEAATWEFSTSAPSIIDAQVGDSIFDAFDEPQAVLVNGTALVGAPTFVGNLAIYPQQTISGLSVQTIFTAAASSATLRQSIVFSNPTNNVITVPVVLNGNLGSDGATQVIQTANGDATFSAADRFLVTDDANTTGGDPTVTTVFFGPGQPTRAPTAASLTAGGDYSAAYIVSLLPGQTRSLMFFHQINTSSELATAEVFDHFNSNGVPGNDKLAGLDAFALGQVLNWDYTKSLSIDDVTVTEGDNGVANAQFSITLNAASAQQVTVQVDINDGSATFAGNDYADGTFTVTFAPGETMQPFTVAVQGDTLAELDETFNVRLSNPVGARIEDGEGVGTIINDDTVTLTINDVTVTEGNNGTKDAVFTISFSNPSAIPVGVMVNVTEGSATRNNNDFAFSNGSIFGVLFGNQITVTVTINGDTVVEPNEAFNVVLSSPGIGVVIGDGNAVGTILNDDAPATNTNIAVSAADAGGGPHVRMFDLNTNAEIIGFYAYDPGFSGGVRVALADFNLDGTVDIVTVPGPGGGPHISVFDGRTGVRMTGPGRDFFAYNAGFLGGLYVAAGDVTGDGFPDIVVGADAGGGPHVKAFDGITGAEIASFFAFDGNFTGGVRVAIGNVDGAGPRDIIAGAGPGAQPTVRVFNGTTGIPLAGFLGSFPAYTPFFQGGVYVSAGDSNGDGRSDVFVGAGATGGPHVKVFSGLDGSELRSFFPYDPGFTGGVRVAAADVNSDGRADLVTGPGPTGGPHVTVLNGLDNAVIASFYAYNPGFTGGMFLAGNPFGNPLAPLRVAGGEVTPETPFAPLEELQFDLFVSAAIDYWRSAGIGENLLGRLSTIEIETMDLAGDLLGLTTRDRVLIDLNAAGHGWHDELEFGEVPADRVDLLTTVAHELGHVLGLDDLDPTLDLLMSGELPLGLRRVPTGLALNLQA